MSVDHFAFTTASTQKTHDFYVGVLGWPLVVAFGDQDATPPWFITGYDAGAFTIEFEEQIGVEPDRLPNDVFPHVGIAATDAEIDDWRARLTDRGVPFFQSDSHDLWLRDPNGLKIQIFVSHREGTPAEVLERSERDLAAWLAR